MKSIKLLQEQAETSRIISASSLDSKSERRVVLTEEEFAGLKAIIEDPTPSTNAQKAFAQPDQFKFESS